MPKLKPLRLELRGVDRLSRVVERVGGGIDRLKRPIRDVRARLRRLSRASGLTRLAGAARNVGTQLAAIGRRAALVGGVLAGVAAAGIRRFVGQGDEIAKFSRSVGLATDFVQEYQFVADRLGVSQKTLNTSFVAFSKRLGEAQNGYGRLNTLLKRTNPDLLAQLEATSSVEKAFTLLIEEMGEMEDSAKRSALAAAAFSRQGVRLTNIATAGATEIERLRQRARDLGFVMDEQTLAASEKLTDTWTNLGAITKGIGFTIASGLLPTIQGLSSRLATWAEKNQELIRTRAEQFASRLAEGVRLTVRFVERAVPAVQSFVDSLGGWKVIAGALAGLMAGKLVIALGALVAALFSPIGLVLALAAGVGVLIVKWDAVKAAMGRFWEWVTSLDPKILLAAGPIGALILAVDKIIENWKPLKSFFTNLWGGIVGIIQEKVSSLRNLLPDFVARRIGFEVGAAEPPRSTPSAVPAGLREGFGPAGEPSQTRVGGRLDIRVDTETGQTRVTRLESESRDFELEVDTGLAMGTP